MTDNNLLNKWDELIETAEAGESAQEVATRSRHQTFARIMENQESDFGSESVYRDEKLAESFGSLQEAEIGGDHGYDASNIAAGQTTGAVTHIAPAVMGMVSRALPKLIAFDVAGVQPMSAPTSQVFALRSIYGKDPLASGAKEAFHPMYAPDANFSGSAAAKAFDAIAASATLAAGVVYTYVFAETGLAYLQVAGEALTAAAAGELEAWVLAQVAASTLVEINEGMATSIAELQEGFNGSEDNAWNEMTFRIDKQTVESKTRQLKASYSIELAQDLRRIHGIDADAQLSSVLTDEVVLEINREVVNWINYTAQVGKTGMTQAPNTQAGVFNFNDPLDVRGARWAGESFKALLFQIDKEAAEIARQTGRGAGNFIIASRNVVNVLASVDKNISPAGQGLASGLNTDTTKSTFAGILNGRYKVYIDQYARHDYFTVGYKGANEMDAGIYYAPYIMLTPLRGADPKNFAPVLGFKTRYGIGINPFYDTKAQTPKGRITSGMPGIDAIGKNGYFRRVGVVGI